MFDPAMQDWRKIVGKNVRKIRQERAMTQEKLAFEAEIDLIARFKQHSALLVGHPPSTEWQWITIMQHHGVPHDGVFKALLLVCMASHADFAANVVGRTGFGRLGTLLLRWPGRRAGP